MTTIGQLDRKITIERQDGWIDDGWGTPTPGDFVPVATVHAKRTDVSDREKLIAAQVMSQSTSRFVVRSSSITRAITSMDRLQHEGAIWGIDGIKETQDGRRRFLEITATKAQ